MILLKIDNVSLTLDGSRIIRNLNFSVPQNEIVGLIGATESGKSSLFDLISGVYIPDEGKITLAGIDITPLTIEKLTTLGVARTFQNANFFSNFSVTDNIRLGFHNSLKYNLFDVILRTQKFFSNEKEIDERTNELISIFNLSDYADMFPNDIPYDAQCRLDIARAVATSPKLLLLDRPTGGLGINQAEEFMSTIEMVNRRFKTAIVIIENDLNLLLNICSEISVMEYGTIIATDNPIEIKNNQVLTSICLGE